MKIELRNLTVEHPGHILALDRVSCVFDSQATGSVALLGANGAGKSTLLSAILGLIVPASGAVYVDGVKVEKNSFTSIRRKIGMVFQNPDDQLFSQTVAEDVAFGPVNLHLPPDTVDARVSCALNALGIASLAAREVIRLSGGEKRRAALAGVLAMNPEAILLDEPTSMLDPRACRELAAHLNGLPAMKLAATHDLLFASRVCRHCIILQNGRIFAQGETGRLLENRALLLECGLA